MADKQFRYIIDWLDRLVEYTSLLVFIPDEKRWGEYNRSQRQIEDDDTYGGRPYYDITPERAKEIYVDSPPDGWCRRENEDYYDWKDRITTESDRELIRNSKKRINRMKLKVISEKCEKRDEIYNVMKTTIVYECPCGKGQYIYWKEHTGFDDWGASLNCDECEKNYYSM